MSLLARTTVKIPAAEINTEKMLTSSLKYTSLFSNGGSVEKLLCGTQFKNTVDTSCALFRWFVLQPLSCHSQPLLLFISLTCAHTVYTHLYMSPTCLLAVTCTESHKYIYSNTWTVFFVTDYRDTSIHFHLSLSLFFSLRHIHIKIQHGWVICNCPRKWQNIKLLTKSILTYAWQMWADKWWNWCTDTLCILCWHCFELIKCWLRI